MAAASALPLEGICAGSPQPNAIEYATKTADGITSPRPSTAGPVASQAARAARDVSLETQPVVLEPVKAPAAAVRSFLSTEAALAASRKPLFLTNTLLCATDAAALLQQENPMHLARQLDRLLQLQEFVVQLRESTAAIPPHSSSNGGNRDQSNSSGNHKLGDPPEESRARDAAAVRNNGSSSNTKNSSNSNSNSRRSSLTAPVRVSIVGVDRHEDAGARPQAVAAADSSQLAAGSLTNQHTVEQIKQQGIYQQRRQQEMQQQHEDQEAAAAHCVALEYFLSAVAFCRLNSFSPRAVSTFLALLISVYRQSVQQRLSPSASFDVFKSQLLRHSIQRPPWATAVFSFTQLHPATEFFLNHFLRLLPQLQQLHSRHSPRSNQHRSSGSQGAGCSSFFTGN
ncbi:hypothetical protein, conserved [Eimeria necatrix]|uniref:Uncharacterized protein n=1 Tax=Eimeria necatrix TaxID=51315 RepID=U6N8Y8_9EIME|nr:hypothetical protein, conserved [Eimeria necatrix]CDJ70336.1 hypothetical protein, conserved [Eimeria necatrix]